MLVDSHCHLNFPELHDDLDNYLALMRQNDVDYALCVGTRPDNLERIVAMATKYPHLFASVGIHPDEKLDDFTLTPEFLEQYTSNPKVIAIGETGLDYYRVQNEDMSWQHQRFIMHIELAKKVDLPLRSFETIALFLITV